MRDSAPSPRYSAICNALHQWKTSLIPTCRVYRLYDIVMEMIALRVHKQNFNDKFATSILNSNPKSSVNSQIFNFCGLLTVYQILSHLSGITIKIWTLLKLLKKSE